MFARVSVLFLSLAGLAGFAGLAGCQSLVPSGTQGPSETSSDDGEVPTTGSELPPPPDPASISVATYNVRRFFDPHCDSGNCNSGDYEDVPTEGQFTYRADTLATAIADLNADIVVLQEIENQDCLDALTERLGNAYPTALLGETGLAASLDVAVLSRYPSLELRRHASTPLTLPSGGKTWFSREFLEVHFDAEGQRAIVFAAHFKAKINDDPDRRLAEATRAREVVDSVAQAHPLALLVLAGDLNDTPDSPPLRALEDEDGLLRVAAELAPDDWTYRFMGMYEPIDHLLMATTTGVRYLEGSAVIFRGEGEAGYAGSDHAAVRASFRAGE